MDNKGQGQNSGHDNLRVLVLDDDPNRDLLIQWHLQGRTGLSASAAKRCIQFVRNVPDFIEVCTASAEPFDYIYLDYALRTKHTGVDAARFLVDELPWKEWPRQIFVHSFHPFGAERILDVLLDGGAIAKPVNLFESAGGRREND